MRNLRVELILLIFTALLGTGCERIVDIDVPDPDLLLVVEGRIERLRTGEPSIQWVRLTQTAPAIGSGALPPARGAAVSVTDGSGLTVPFSEVPGDPGLFQSAPFLPSVGQTYTLHIEHEGDSYRAAHVLRPVPPIDSLYFEYRDANELFGDSAGYRAVVDYTDLPASEDYYYWEVLIGGELMLVPDAENEFSLLSSDETYPGGTITGFVPNEDAVVGPDEEVEVRQYALTRETFDFIRAVLTRSGAGDGSPFAVPPASIRGNVSNVTDPSRPALGHFFAAEVAVARASGPDTIPGGR